MLTPTPLLLFSPSRQILGGIFNFLILFTSNIIVNIARRHEILQKKVD